MFLRYFAHSENLHKEQTSNLVHQLTQPIMSLVLLSLLLCAIWLVGGYLFKLQVIGKLFMIMVVCIVVGVIGYATVPIASIAAITIGIILALGFSLIALAG